MRIAKPIDRIFKRDDTIWHEGDIVDGFGLIETGTLLCHRYHTDGKVQLARLFVPGDIINIETAVSNKRTSPYFVVAATAGNYIWFPSAVIFGNNALLPNIVCRLQANLLANLADDMIRFMKKSDILSQRTVRGRIKMYLNILREQFGNEVEIGMNQEEFAQYLCVDRSSLSEELNKMRREGLIDFKKKRFSLLFD